LDRDVVVARVDVAVGDRDVRGAGRIDAVGISRTRVARVDDQPPYRKAVAAVVHDVEVRRVLERELVDREIVGPVDLNESWTALALVDHLRELREIPPR